MTRTGLILDQVVIERDGRWLTDEPFIRFIEASASALFDEIDLCTRVRTGDDEPPYALNPAVFHIERLPFYSGLAELCARAPVLLPEITRLISRAMTQWDFVIACGIHPVSAIALRLARRRHIPAQLWLRGDVAADVRYRYRGLQRLAGLAAVRAATAAIPSQTPIVSVGRDDYPMLGRMGPLLVAYDSKFDREDIVDRPPAVWPRQTPPRLLYVGRLAAEKGLDVLLETMRLLRRAPFDLPVTLTIAGAATHGSAFAGELRAAVERKGLADAVTLAGHVSCGLPLFQLYDAHDVLVLPSFTEGFPQVVLEAMARGVPVVATSVGGIPRVARSGRNAVLVAPGRPDELARAIASLVEHPAQAVHLAEAGLETASRFVQSGQIAAIAQFTKQCQQATRVGGLPRAVEVTLAMLGLALAAPFLLLAGLAIALTSPGPVIFRHLRAGRHGRPFSLLKLRTMRVGGIGSAVTASHDPRITPVGRFLRRTKLDELPQLWNVVVGDMALVGSRPEALEYVDMSRPIWRDVLSVRPGLTDPTTVALRSEEELLAHAAPQGDCFYREQLLPYKLRGSRAYQLVRTWKSDIAILGLTIVCIVRPIRTPSLPLDVAGVCHDNHTRAVLPR